MTLRFYASDDGEVLSSKDYPVNKPVLRLPCIDPVPVADLIAGRLPTATIRDRTYKAYTVKMGDASE